MVESIKPSSRRDRPRCIYAVDATRRTSLLESEAARTPFYRIVPKSRTDLLRFRKKCLELGSSSEEARKDLVRMCARDMLFWVNVFVWTFDPRLEGGKIVPFNTYPFQDEALLQIEGAIGKRDQVAEKSRDQGASWMFLLPLVWRWLFFDNQTFLLVSRTENLVDKTADPKSLFWKVDCIIKHLPSWMTPDLTRTKLHLANLTNGSVIDGESTTGNIGRGDRRLAVVLDEFAAFDREDGYRALAATQQVTKSRFFNSTPSGVGNAHYDMVCRARDPRSKVDLLRMHWSDHPVQARGLYQTDSDGDVEILDTSYHFPEGYEFITDGKLRSVYYDEECLRTPVESLIAQELDINYLGSGAQFFNPEELERIEREYARPPISVGDLEFDAPGAGVYTWTPRKNGRMSMWINVDAKGDVPADRSYVVGVDISAGTGASNSVLSVGDMKTGEKVAEFVSANTRPEELAKIAVAVCRWFSGTSGDGAYLIWEANGAPGRNFGQQVIELGYRNIYWRMDEQKVAKKPGSIPGWMSTKDGKSALLGEYGRALAAGDYINRSRAAIREMGEYVFLPSGGIGHVKAQGAVDPSGARENHGDRVIADALCWRGLKRSPQERGPTTPPVAPVGSFLHRREQYRKERREREYY